MTVGIVGGSDFHKICEQLGSDGAPPAFCGARANFGIRTWRLQLLAPTPLHAAARGALHPALLSGHSSAGRVIAPTKPRGPDLTDMLLQRRPHTTTCLQRMAWWPTRPARRWRCRASRRAARPAPRPALRVSRLARPPWSRSLGGVPAAVRPCLARVIQSARPGWCLPCQSGTAGKTSI